ncbi:MAG: hypothetical protein ACE5H4_11845 [Candidatus Thorarchaeota archaeon]
MPSVAVVLGRGGHTSEALALVDLLGPTFDYIYLIGLLDRLTPRRIRIPGRKVPVLAPRLLPQDSRIMSFLRALMTLFLSLFYFAAFRPKVVVSCGTGMTVPIFYSARITGVRTVYIENMASVESLSLTGRIILGKTDLFLVQWESLVSRIPGVIYGGQLL